MGGCHFDSCSTPAISFNTTIPSNIRKISFCIESTSKFLERGAPQLIYSILKNSVYIRESLYFLGPNLDCKLQARLQGFTGRSTITILILCLSVKLLCKVKLSMLQRAKLHNMLISTVPSEVETTFSTAVTRYPHLKFQGFKGWVLSNSEALYQMGWYSKHGVQIFVKASYIKLQCTQASRLSKVRSIKLWPLHSAYKNVHPQIHSGMNTRDG